jgi:hypothetical protein
VSGYRDELFNCSNYYLGPVGPAAILRDLASALRDQTMILDRDTMAGWIDAVATELEPVP